MSLKGDEIAVSGRLMRVENITLEPGEGGWPSLIARVGASSYIVPETTATDAGPAGGATPPGTTTTTTTTTAATGSNAGSELR